MPSRHLHHQHVPHTHCRTSMWQATICSTSMWQAAICSTSMCLTLTAAPACATLARAHTHTPHLHAVLQQRREWEVAPMCVQVQVDDAHACGGRGKAAVGGAAVLGRRCAEPRVRPRGRINREMG